MPDTYGQESTYFALYDVDGDGQEELLLNWTGASMADTGITALMWSCVSFRR